MRFPLFDAPPVEPSRFVGYAGNIIDRQSENRADDSASKALENPAARILLMRGGRLYLRPNGTLAQAHHGRDQALELGGLLDQAVLLGFDADGPVLAAPTDLDPEALPDGVKAVDYRSLHNQGLLGEADLGAVAQGAALIAWHGSHRFCGRCGHATEIRSGGYKRICANCGAEHFPRTDPVVIMLTVREDSCLLGRSPRFAAGSYSTLAGFVEPGETIEAAVRRETFEEAGIRVGRVAYHASQPWPFPYSLMIGCFGEALTDEIVIDRNELEDCRWFSRADVRAVVSGDTSRGFVVPPRFAIAHHLIRAWAESEG